MNGTTEAESPTREWFQARIDQWQSTLKQAKTDVSIAQQKIEYWKAEADKFEQDN